MTQQWNPAAYGEHGSFVHQLAGGVFELLAPQAGEAILDLGCGDGQLTARIAATGAVVTGVDASAEMAAAARARWIAADVAKAEELPYRDGSFDAVFSNAALHWVRDQDAMMTQVRRVLRPGGRFVAEFGGHGNIAAISVALRAVLLRHGLNNLEDGFNYYPSVDGYTGRLQHHGFKVEQIALIPRPTPLGAGGMAEWLKTFRRGVLDAVPEKLREAVLEEAVALLAPVLRDEAGNWTADYVRLRFKAWAV